MDGYQYEQKCAELLKAKGFSNVQVTPGSGDQGIDVIAYQSKKKYGVQCKYYEGTVGNKAVQEVYAGAAYYSCDIALVITNSTLTKPAKELAKKLNVEVWEHIDAIYLQIHTAEYIKREKEWQREDQERANLLWKSQEKERKLIENKKAILVRKIELLNSAIGNCDFYANAPQQAYNDWVYTAFWMVGSLFVSWCGFTVFPSLIGVFGGLLIGLISSTCAIIWMKKQYEQKVKDEQQNKKKEWERKRNILEEELRQLNKDLDNIK